ncbi:VWA domain-containing protein [Beggiatoa leptomitoformis]|uniref:VWA domain-containing protein n=2 Tax=Beggiatoa leptomitoformis TaxID=288004 RepID=A0A2N9YGG7_9GAMM|nr:VWA domain-containing protein [Beggiatoa leptomitoformis]AUI69618.1 VWA domain-containing protein [Beggiatoa leptomitoformis]
MRYFFICLIIWGCSMSTVQALQIKLESTLANPLLLTEQKQTTYLRVAVTGFRLQKENTSPVNVALVIDKSGSMQGQKIQQAKAAAKIAVERLRKDDIISIVSYDHQVDVLLPATKATDKQMIYAAIDKIVADGNTALYDGVQKGADELRKFLTRNQINRLVLVSDGLANVGPDTPQALGELGAKLSQAGISVTTIGLGLGYNEDLMTQLAKQSEGSHSFVENATDLTRIFDHEFGDLLSVVAQEVIITIQCAEGVRPVKILGREANINGQQIHIPLNQLYSEQEKYVLLEIEISPPAADQLLTVATVTVDYRNMSTNTLDQLTSQINARFTNNRQQVKDQTNAAVMANVVEQLAIEKNKRAVTLRDEGKVDEAKELLLENAQQLEQGASQYNAPSLSIMKEKNEQDADNLDEKNWNKQRKLMREEQYKRSTQQKY